MCHAFLAFNKIQSFAFWMEEGRREGVKGEGGGKEKVRKKSGQ